jgi:hypothetical protein
MYFKYQKLSQCILFSKTCFRGSICGPDDGPSGRKHVALNIINKYKARFVIYDGNFDLNTLAY